MKPMRPAEKALLRAAQRNQRALQAIARQQDTGGDEKRKGADAGYAWGGTEESTPP